MIAAGLLTALTACTSPSSVARVDESIVAGAGYTTFDATQGGCKDSPNGIDCNNYVSKDDVYMSGGPSKAGLSDGDYYFAVLVPGTQNGGFVDGAAGNLSSPHDAASNRTFTVSGHNVVTYAGTHLTGHSPNGSFIIQLMPYDDTTNAGGVYILAICQVGATSPSQCKYDAFRVSCDSSEHHFPVVSGGKYYDANANGVRDPGEVGIANWPIHYTDEVADTIYTDAAGNFSLTLVADTYVFNELQSTGGGWMQTGNLVSQAVASAGAVVTLNADKTYSVAVADDTTVSGLYFGNLCVGAGGGLTLGFWSNKNGQALITASDLAYLDLLDLRDAAGAAFDPTTKTQLRTWLLNGTATNMAYMLSVQLSAMVLNVRHGFVAGGALVYAPGASSANANGFTTIAALISEANATLGVDGNTVDGDPLRAYQEALKTALDQANNNLNFVQSTPAGCPAPTF
jgi:hypothetical protein